MAGLVSTILSKNSASGLETSPSPAGGGPGVSANASRFEAIFDAEFDFVWRLLRRMGVHEDPVDDACQEVFVLVARKLDQIAVGFERSYLFGCARRVAAQHRRHVRRDDRLAVVPRDELPGHNSPHSPESLLGEKRLRAMLDDLLGAMDEELRSVFVLHEIEGLTAAQIAQLEGIPPGTVASRLRRARQHFAKLVNDLKLALEGGGT